MPYIIYLYPTVIILITVMVLKISKKWSHIYSAIWHIYSHLYWRDWLKQTNGRDNLTSVMQMVSMVTVFIVRNLAIKSLNVESMDKDWCSTPQGGLWIKEIFFILTILQKLWSNVVYAIKLDICLPNVLWEDVIHHLTKDTNQKDASSGKRRWISVT